jgi:ribose-phosphate pyrophosphokinase
VLHKRRLSGAETKVTHVVGDVAGRPCLIVDDMISPGGTMAESITALLTAGVRPAIMVAVTHGLFVRDAWKNLSHPAVCEIWVIARRRLLALRCCIWHDVLLDVLSADQC